MCAWERYGNVEIFVLYCTKVVLRDAVTVYQATASICLEFFLFIHSIISIQVTGIKVLPG